MTLLKRFLGRLFPALLMALSVVLLTGGLFAYAPLAIGEGDDPATLEPGDPAFEATAPPTAVAGTDEPPTPEPPTSPAPSPWPSPAATDPPATPAAPTATPGGATEPPPTPDGPTPSPITSPSPGDRELATRIVIPSLGIDLPVVPSDLVVPGNRDFFPLCDVAQYMVEFSQPGEAGSTYIYAHARTGMFLPLLEQSRRSDGRGMLGALVEVYTSHNRLHLYEIYLVKRHATDLSLVYELPPEGQQVIMQTSEGPRGTVPKLQVAAKPISVVPSTRAEAQPRPEPRACR
jgi:hypothetical protein